MQKVITINLNGNAYQLDESAYDLLRAYLDRAAAQLANNPDRDEIMSDFEQAIAEKCQRVLGANKSVVTTAEMDQILREMGPVESGAGEQPDAAAGEPRTASASAGSAPPPKRLYRIREGAMWEGVCTGLAAFSGLDVSIIRLIFFMLTLASFGAVVLAYMALVWIVPEAQTSDERAAAYGQLFNAQEIVDQVRKHAAAFADRDDWKQWKRQWREQRRQWRSQKRAWRRHRGQGYTAPPPPFTWWNPGPRPKYETPIWIGYLLPLFSVISLALFAGLILSIVSLVNTGALFGWPLPAGLPIWGGVVILVVMFQIVTGPVRAARHLSYHAFGGGLFAAWDALVGLTFTALFIWLLMRHMPPVHDFAEFMRNLPAAFKALALDFRIWVSGVAESF